MTTSEPVKTGVRIAAAALAVACVALVSPAQASSRLVVTTHGDVSAAALRTALGFEPAAIAEYSHAWHVTLPLAAEPEAARDSLTTVRGVRGVHLDRVAQGAGWGWGKWSKWGWGWGSWFKKSYTNWHDHVLGFNGLSKKFPAPTNITVAILDSGLITTDGGTKAESPALAGSPITLGYDFVNDTEFPDDDNGHGTMMATIIANAAPGVKLMPVKVLDADRVGSEATLAAGIDYAVLNGADIISMSLAFPEGYVPSGFLAAAVERAEAAGVVLVAATGNHGNNEVSYPAAFGSVIAVGSVRLSKWYFGWYKKNAVKRTDWAEYSGYGSAIDIAGAGGHLGFDLNFDGYADGVMTEGFAPDGGYEQVLVSGTSAATAQIAGLSARLLATGATPEQVRPALQKGAYDASLDGFDSLTGAGVAQAAPTLKKLTSGRVPTLADRYVNFTMVLLTNGSQNRAAAYVEVMDANNQPVPDATVLGHFRGDIRHDVVGTTDENGIALLGSLPADGDGAFEFTVDKVFTSTQDGGGGDMIAAVPKTFARFGITAFRQMAAFTTAPSTNATVTGAGAGVSPFLVAFPSDDMIPLVNDRAVSIPRGPDLPPSAVPVSTLPEDFEDWVPVETLFARNFGRNAVAGPTGYLIARDLAASDCDSIANTPIVAVRGADAGVSPFSPADAGVSPFDAGVSPFTKLYDPSGDTDTILIRDEGNFTILYLNGNPVDMADLDIDAGTGVIVDTRLDEALCTTTTRVVADVDSLPTDIVDSGSRTVDGVTMSIVAFEDEPEFAEWQQGWLDVLSRLDEDGTLATEDTVMEGTNASDPFATGAEATMTSTDWTDAATP